MRGIFFFLFNVTANIAKKKFEPDSYIESVKAQGQFLNFNVNKEEYIRETLLNVFEEKERYGHTLNDRSVLIHLGSPAKHHEGHLKRMILGGFIQRIYEANGYKCYKLNDLGDEKNLYGK